MTLIKYVIAAIVTYCVSHVLLVYFPDPLFPHKYTFKNYTVHTRDPIPPRITVVLGRVDSLLSVSELNNESRHHDIYFINSFRLSRFLLLRNVHFGCCLPNGNVFITSADVANDIARCKWISPDDRRVRTLSGAIVHEITHTLIQRRVGWSENRRLPVWVKEGYCDFIARDSAIDVRSAVALLTSPSCPSTPGLRNFRFRLVVDYLISVKHKTIDEIIRDPPDFDVVMAEVIAGLQGEGEGFVERLGSWTEHGKTGEVPG